MSVWIKVCKTESILENGGSCVKVGDEQIAIFNFDHRQQWYAVENRCPHSGQHVLSRGLVGRENGVPKIACPLHKNSFSLETGRHLGDNEGWQLKRYALKIEDDDIYLQIGDGQGKNDA